jgi:hypothetical protein
VVLLGELAQQLTFRGVERLGDRGVDVLVGDAASPIGTDVELAAGESRVQPHVESVPLLLALVGCLYDDVATGEATFDAAQTRDPLANAALHALGRLHSTEHNLDGVHI